MDYLIHVDSWNHDTDYERFYDNLSVICITYTTFNDDRDCLVRISLSSEAEVYEALRPYLRKEDYLIVKAVDLSGFKSRFSG
jgi:hypothetical protein